MANPHPSHNVDGPMVHVVFRGHTVLPAQPANCLHFTLPVLKVNVLQVTRLCTEVVACNQNYRILEEALLRDVALSEDAKQAVYYILQNAIVNEVLDCITLRRFPLNRHLVGALGRSKKILLLERCTWAEAHLTRAAFDSIVAVWHTSKIVVELHLVHSLHNDFVLSFLDQAHSFESLKILKLGICDTQLAQGVGNFLSRVPPNSSVVLALDHSRFTRGIVNAMLHGLQSRRNVPIAVQLCRICWKANSQMNGKEVQDLFVYFRTKFEALAMRVFGDSDFHTCLNECKSNGEHMHTLLEHFPVPSSNVRDDDFCYSSSNSDSEPITMDQVHPAEYCSSSSSTSSSEFEPKRMERIHSDANSNISSTSSSESE